MIETISHNVTTCPPVETEGAACRVPDELWERIALRAGPQATLQMSCVSTNMRRALKDVRGLVADIAHERLGAVSRAASAEREVDRRAYLVERRLETLYLFEQVPLVGPVVGLLLVESRSRAARRLKKTLGWHVACLPVSLVAMPMRVAPLIYGLQALSRRRQVYLTTKADTADRLACARQKVFSHGISEDYRWRLAIERKWVAAPVAPVAPVAPAAWTAGRATPGVEPSSSQLADVL